MRKWSPASESGSTPRPRFEPGADLPVGVGGGPTAQPPGTGWGSAAGLLGSRWERIGFKEKSPGRTPRDGRSGGHDLRSAANLSESVSPRAVAPVFALAAGLPGAAFESEITLTTKGGRAMRCLLTKQPARSPS